MAALAALLCFIPATPALAQDAPYYSPEQLDHMVSRIALYPDPLLAQVLAGATFPDQIPDAARWADQHRYMSGGELAEAINYDQLPWDPSVQALLPFPSVLDMMASDMRWTEELGDAFLGNQQEVMYAVQRMRQRARDYGYLRSNPQVVVTSGPYITIVPARPDYVVVPVYDPVVVYERPRPGFFIGAAIGYRFGVTLGVAFRPWGWGYNRIGWNERVVVINNTPWRRTWINRHEYVHPYTVRRVVVVDHDHDRDWRERERHEAERREAERREHEHDRGNSYYAHERNEERKEAHRERVEDRKEEHREFKQEERREEHREARQEAHNDVGHVERHDAGRVDHHEDHGQAGGGGPHNDNHGQAHGNGNGNHDKKDHDDKGHDR
jgi:hypothetical protein